MALEPTAVAVGEGRRGEAMGEHREPHGEVDREDEQLLVGKLGLLDHDQGEHDRGQTAGPEPAQESHRRHTSVRAHHRDRDGQHSHDGEAEDRVEGELPADLTQRGSEQDRPEEDECDPVEHASHLLGEPVDVLGIALDHRPEDEAGDEGRDEARSMKRHGGAVREGGAGGGDDLAPGALDQSLRPAYTTTAAMSSPPTTPPTIP